ncbi:ketosynthase chain-length factor [Pseudonocardia sp. EC080610-09]|uniref:ketosynthase chain-length factor n=1 Tax=unclassified Pseudonocardia TaxID=2619320 RepID=UPI0035180BA0
MTTTTVVTGVGVTAPNGLGTEDYWRATLEGRSGIGPVTRFDASRYPTRLAGEVLGFDARDHLPGRLLPQTDRVTQLSLTAADWALADAGVVRGEVDQLRSGVITASTCGGFEFGQNELQALWSRGSEYVSAYQSFAWFYAVNTGQISIRNGMRGPSSVVVTDHAGGLDAVAQARQEINDGSVMIVTGGMDASICPWGWVGHLAGNRMSADDDRHRAYRPFAADASGHVAGEGGAMMIAEDADSARARGARVYGEVSGYGATIDPSPESGREPGLRRAILAAIQDAGVTPSEIDVVFADGAARADLDRVEADALVGVFGQCGVPVTVPKSLTGRLGAGSGSLDVVTALLAMRDGLIPPTVNVDPDPAYGLDLVIDRPRLMDLHVSLVLARGVGGFNSALVLRA